jgi:hydrogenase maturation protease
MHAREGSKPPATPASDEVSAVGAPDKATNERSFIDNTPAPASTPTASAPRVGILCLGNLLMQDEGLGPRVADELARGYLWPEGAEVCEGGVMGMALLADLPRFDVLIIVDAVDKTGHKPGTVLTFRPEDIAPRDSFCSAHETRLTDVLEAAALLGINPKTHCLGVQVLNRAPQDYVIGLTPPVEAAVPLLVQKVLELCASYGVFPKKHGF